jgi:hypothetical protein
VSACAVCCCFLAFGRASVPEGCEGGLSSTGFSGPAMQFNEQPGQCVRYVLGLSGPRPCVFSASVPQMKWYTPRTVLLTPAVQMHGHCTAQRAFYVPGKAK